MNNNTGAKTRSFLGEFVLIAITILWGCTFVIVKKALQDVSPTLYVAVRFTIALLFLLPVYLWKRDRKEKFISWQGAFLGLWLFLGFVTQTVGLRLTTATKSGFITGTFVLFIPFFQIFIEKKKPARGTIIGIFFVFIGLLFLSSSGNSIWDFIVSLGNDFNFGDFLTLLCAVFFAVQVVFIDKYSKEHSVLNLLFSQLLTVSVLSFISVFLFDAASLEAIKWEFNGYILFSLLFTALIATLINIGLQTRFQKSVSPSKAGIIYSFEPLFSALLAFFILNEKIGNFGYIGSILIFAGLIIAEVYDNLFNKNGKGFSKR